MSHLFITSADFVGECEKCGQPTCGQFDSDEDCNEQEDYWCTLECVNCHKKYKVRLLPLVKCVS